MRLIVSPCAGARAFILEDKRYGDNLFTTVGAFRDAWTPALAPSSRDYIAKYTHPIATGTFNRCYAARIDAHSAQFRYDAPDAPPDGMAFRKRIRLDGQASVFEVLQARISPGSGERTQQLTSFFFARGARLYRAANGCAIYDAQRRRVMLVSWPVHALQHAILQTNAADVLLTVTSADGTLVLRLGFARASTMAQAQALLRQFANRRFSAR